MKVLVVAGRLPRATRREAQLVKALLETGHTVVTDRGEQVVGVQVGWTQMEESRAREQTEAWVELEARAWRN